MDKVNNETIRLLVIAFKYAKFTNRKAIIKLLDKVINKMIEEEEA